MTSEQFIAARKTLGYTRPEMAVALGLRGEHSVRTIDRLETGASISGPMALAVQKLLDDAGKANA
jgi:transcriptional regulator with XRE-family HTH domain